MTVYLKNVETGHVFNFDGVADADLINKRLLAGKYELVNNDKISKAEEKVLEIPEVPTTQPIKNRLLNIVGKK
jgi:hypothetical protein